jgi:hypothetical protein
VQAEAQVFQCDDPVQLGQLTGIVEAVSGRQVDAGRLKEPDRVVVTQHPHGHPAVPGELPDSKHDTTMDRPSHDVRVKYGPPGALTRRTCCGGGPSDEQSFRRGRVL